MFLDPQLASAQPLMVVGLPRCGTTFVAQVLNTHPQILLRDELSDAAAASMGRFIREVSDFYGGLDASTNDGPAWYKPARARGWQQGKRELMYALWSTLTKSPPAEPEGSVDWFGHSTPRHDRYWREYRDVFGPDQPVRYVFCMREFTAHYRSAKAMNGRSITTIAKRYREAVNRYAEMKAVLGDYVSLFLLDDLKNGGGRDYLRRTLFTDLGIDPDEESLARIDPGRPPNSLRGRGLRDTLTPDEETFMERNPDLAGALDVLREASLSAHYADDLISNRGR